jgi:hypothetical protein
VTIEVSTDIDTRQPAIPLKIRTVHLFFVCPPTTECGINCKGHMLWVREIKASFFFDSTFRFVVAFQLFRANLDKNFANEFFVYK